MPNPAAAPPPAGPAAGAPASARVGLEVARLRRRALAVLLAGAALAAVAADVWYEIAGFWTQRLLRHGIYFPLFFLVAFAVLAARAFLRTRTARLAAELDEAAGLKLRLSAAGRYARLAGLDPAIREAQARETLRSVDFPRLRARFRLRPWASLAFLAAGVAGILWLMQRYPESFRPRNLAFRQGRVIFVTVKNLGGGTPPRGEGSGGAGTERLPDDHPTVVPIPEPGSAPQPPKPGGEGTPPEGQPPPGGGSDREKPPGEEHDGRTPAPESAPERPPRDTEVAGKGASREPGPNEGGALGRPSPLEETRAVTGPTARPDQRFAARAGDLGAAEARLPPLPFFRLVGGRGAEGGLYDPETLTIVLEAYPPKYRRQLEAYLKALQTLREERHGS